jgi:hypothetical protein
MSNIGKRTYNVKLRRVRANSVALVKQYILNKTVFVILGIQEATRIRHVVMCGFPGSKIFSTLFEKQARLKKSFNIKCVFLYTSNKPTNSLF